MDAIIKLDNLIEQMNNFKTQKDVAKFIKKYKELVYLPMIMMDYTDELRAKGQYDTAILIYLELERNKHLPYIYNDVGLWFRLGEYYINNGDTEKGKSYLIKLCDHISNYEESLAIRGLTEDWQKLKPYVIDEIRPSIATTNTEDNEPMSDDELLDLFIQELASGGIHAYLTNYGHRLEETLAAAIRNQKPLTVKLLELIKTKYFFGKMPKNLDEIENIILENDWWFEEEDQYYYDIEKEFC